MDESQLTKQNDTSVDKIVKAVRIQTKLTEIKEERGDFLKFVKILQEKGKIGLQEIDGIEAEAKENMWLKQKRTQQQRALLRTMVSQMKLEPEFQTRFFEGLLLPDKLTAEYM